MIRTWSLEETLIRAQSVLVVVAQRVWDGLAGLERVTRPPRTGHPFFDWDESLAVSPDGYYGYAEPNLEGPEWLAEREESEEVWEPAEMQADIRAFGVSSVLGWMQQNRRTDVSVQCGHCLETFGDFKAFAVHLLTCDLQPDSADIPRNGSAEHPAGVDTSFPTSVPPAGPQLDWHGWAEPAVMEVLSEHRYAFGYDTNCECGQPGIWDFTDWIEHVAPEVVARIGCDPARAIAALHNHKPK
jgi:hypothetical protein